MERPRWRRETKTLEEGWMVREVCWLSIERGVK